MALSTGALPSTPASLRHLLAWRSLAEPPPVPRLLLFMAQTTLRFRADRHLCSQVARTRTTSLQVE